MPQYNADTEAALIGAVLKNPKTYQIAADIVRDEDFYFIHNQNVWQAICKLANDGMGIDTITVGDELERSGKLSDVMNPTKQFSGRAALSWMRENTDARNAETYAAETLDYSAKRKIEQICISAVNWSQNGRKAHEIVSDLAQRMDAVKTHDIKVRAHTMTMAEAVSQAYDHIDAASRGEVRILQTGYPDIDKVLGGGLTAPDVLVIAGRPGEGKTALKSCIAKNVVESGKRVIFFSLEMDARQIAMRFIAMESGIDFGKQKSGKLTEGEWALYTNAVDKLGAQDYGLVINDLPAISPSGIRRELRRLGHFDLVLVDYVQLASADGEHERRDLQIGEITRGVKSLAKEFSVPFIIGAQMNRDTEKRKDARPQLSDLRESGSIENDADIVAFIHRPDKLAEKFIPTELIFEKNRNGAKGIVNLIYHAERTRFNSATAKEFNPN